MAWVAYSQWQATGVTGPVVFHALAAAGLLVPRLRIVMSSVFTVIIYRLSALDYNGQLDWSAVRFLPAAALATFVGWPRLIEFKTP